MERSTGIVSQPRINCCQSSDLGSQAPDLLMIMMDSGKGSSKARAGVFFLSAGFALTAMFENICVSLLF